ncbi:hypothetical protein ABW21_db0209484 [Orbilia brochopaga]|nr:hypothetical protein ABW21_db0209484 [Drechslerella brochopaga]
MVSARGEQTDHEPLLQNPQEGRDEDSPDPETLVVAEEVSPFILSSDPSPSSIARTLPETATFGRNLGWLHVYSLVISRIIGSGIFATPGSIYRSVGSAGLSLVLWIAGALIAACALSVSLEFGCMLPRSGGDKVYLEFTYPRPKYLASILFAFYTVFLYSVASNCIVFGEYLTFALGLPSTKLANRGFALALLTWAVVIHGCFLRTGIAIQTALGYIKLLLMGFITLTAVVVIARGQGTADTGSPFKGSIWGWGSMSTALLKITYAYTGYASANDVMNEIKNPVQTLKTATRAALATVCLMYLFVNLAYFSVVDGEDIKNSGELIAGLFFERVFGQNIGRRVLSLAVAISTAGNVMVGLFSQVRSIPTSYTDDEQSSSSDSETLLIVPLEPRSSPSRGRALWEVLFLFKAVQCPPCCIVCELCPGVVYHHRDTASRRVRIHPRCPIVCSAVFCICCRYRIGAAPALATRSDTTL